jgi:ubiquinone/menaquinone biosynthesis C-methylase UbiE
MKHRELIQQQFDRQAEIYAEMEQTRDNEAHDVFVSLCGADDRHKVLDVACGPGFLTRRFARVSKEVTGIDITTAFLDMATSLASAEELTNVTFMDGDVTSMPFDADTFDIVTCRAAFHHFPDPQHVLKEMVRVAKVGGTVAIGDLTSSENAEKAEYHHKMEILCDPSHTRALPLGRFRSMIEKSGLVLRNEFTGSQDYKLEDWITHGSPVDEAADKIRQYMHAALTRDLCDLDVRQEEGDIKFTHQTVLLLATKTAT